MAGSGVWWIRYRVNGILRREKVGRKGDAIDLYHTRKAGIRAGVKLPNNLRSTGVKFRVLAEAILTYSDAHHKDRRNIISRLKRIQQDFDDRVAEEIKPQEIDTWLTANTMAPATSNRHEILSGTSRSGTASLPDCFLTERPTHFPAHFLHTCRRTASRHAPEVGPG